MDSYFASPERASDQELAAEISLVSKNPVMSGLLHSISGLLAVLDEHRQIVAVNDSFLAMLGIDDPAQALGLRPGEAVQCIHAHDEAAGCGTGRLCASCGAAIAIVASLGEDRPVERICALSTRRGAKSVDMALLVRSCPIRIAGKRFLLLFLQDITHQQQRAALERAYFHDINNMLNMLMAASELLVDDVPSELSEAIHRASVRLSREVAIQRCLTETESCTYQPMWHEFTAGQVLEELRLFFLNHPAAQGKSIDFPGQPPAVTFTTDIALLLRVLCNMVINALEATTEGGRIRIWAERQGDSVSFCVWNDQEIPPDVAGRVFQRNFSTKEQAGRGVGTYSMKLFGEDVLGGQVAFTTGKDEGTVFRFTYRL
ncbi:MAG: PAS domain-containing protein [Candidatus Hydrogenedentes bacterium]|nr:PAS domain-containing protein [Candidatus Hydrogenedentota bacterium]